MGQGILTYGGVRKMSFEINTGIGNVGAIPTQAPVSEVAPVRSAEKASFDKDVMYEKEQGKNQTSEKMLQDTVSELNQKLTVNKIECEFKYHSDINRVSIKLINMSTKEVIREIPAEETLAMIKKMNELTGFIIDEKR